MPLLVSGVAYGGSSSFRSAEFGILAPPPTGGEMVNVASEGAATIKNI
jgi:hypothetical protein